MKNKIKLVILFLFGIIIGVFISYYKVSEQYEFFNCLNLNNKNEQQTEYCFFAYGYKNIENFYEISDFYRLKLAIYYNQGRAITYYKNKENFKDLYPILLDNCFKNLDKYCVFEKLDTHNYTDMDFEKNLNYILEKSPQYDFDFSLIQLKKYLNTHKELCSINKELFLKIKNNKYLNDNLSFLKKCQ